MSRAQMVNGKNGRQHESLCAFSRVPALCIVSGSVSGELQPLADKGAFKSSGVKEPDRDI